MTGIERLSEVVRELGRFSFCYDLYETLGNIADQIEREQDAMVADSPYDALPPDEREAIAWVREHGGVEKIIKQRRDSVPRAAFERKLGKRLRHIAECEEALRRRNATISALEKTADLLRKQIADMRPRLVPEGMEWMVEAWPRFEDDAPVRFSDDFERYGEESVVSAVTMYADGSFALNFRAYSKGEHVKRPDFHNSTKVNARLTSHSPAPAPNVLDADGAEIEVGDDLYSVEGSLKLHVSHVDRINGKIATDAMFALDKWADPTMYTHRAPVLAADGKPLREGETVWYRDHIDPLEVRSISTTESGAQYVKAYNDYEGEVSAPAEDFTHERPVVDTWERLEEDAGCTATKYNERRGTIFTTKQQVARDLVRRARALAGDA